jgi:aspartate kinase
MLIYKFGGASIKDAKGVENIARIINEKKDEPLIVIISATQNTTNDLEKVLDAYFYQQADLKDTFDKVKSRHEEMMVDLFKDTNHPIFDEVANTFVEIDWIIEEEPQDEYDYLYDQIVSIGELVSSKIVNAYLQELGLASKWVDSRDYILTDNNFRNAEVNWVETEGNIQREIPEILKKHIIVTQGFIASTSENFTTTLGREGSDYTAAIFASCLNAKSATIWKDVPGVLNADPKWFSETELISELSYIDAIELTYYGATVIHPKTIKPLQNKEIQLHVRSFIDSDKTGTIIRKTKESLPVPSFIFKVNQVLISVLPKDFSFIVEDNLSHIFSLFHKHKIKVNMMHNSAVNFSVCVDYKEANLSTLVEELKERFNVAYQQDLELVTIRYYNQDTINRVLTGKEIILEVKDSYTCQMLIKSK